MQKIEQITGRGVPLFLDDIDTDRIIPARYLRCVTFDGLGQYAFEDDRQQDKNHPFDNPAYKGASVLVSGRNFGCGSSREHAPQALMRWGIKAVVAESFAEIFFGNCTSLGIPCVTADRASLAKLAAEIQKSPAAELTVDLVKNEVRIGNETFRVSMPESARQALVTGAFDFLGQLIAGEPQIKKTAAALPYLNKYATA
ncbi:MAG: 3-isopropylmalate dehydratase small subunit [Planctomycetaceae bacterium]